MNILVGQSIPGLKYQSEKKKKKNVEMMIDNLM